MTTANEKKLAELKKLLKPKRNKYHVAPKAERTVDGIFFDSKLEATRYLALKALEARGEILGFKRQVPFEFPWGDKYVADFVVFWRGAGAYPVLCGMASHSGSVEDCKGFKTPIYRMKKKILKWQTGIDIVEVTSATVAKHPREASYLSLNPEKRKLRQTHRRLKERMPLGQGRRFLIPLDPKSTEVIF